ncbi:unnamed protein product [Cyprideis torosa]|uniref:Uncharacterized protein n=1 Tax=Cyprideis torosa TaxID=163714 RepID=A0A7R8W8C1_9CRUS|nr:unnamed protein product [Cyprideis torosa]CAG0888441.1 unnamed protein product [Cyprideis torosa]
MNNYLLFTETWLVLLKTKIFLQFPAAILRFSYATTVTRNQVSPWIFTEPGQRHGAQRGGLGVAGNRGFMSLVNLGVGVPRSDVDMKVTHPRITRVRVNTGTTWSQRKCIHIGETQWT